MAPETRNTHSLCSLSVIKKGMLLTKDAMVAPIPSVTRVIGSAQHTNVPVVVNKANQVTLVSLPFAVLLAI
tara:strand:- start:1395 stop:1607 length:213 start_codon:yes stop_codon:yes gene_type:complete